MKLSDKARAVIAAVAPTIGRALGGPLGGLAGNVLAGTLNVSEESRLEAAVLTQTPESLLQLRNAEAAFKIHMRELDISEADLERDDIFADKADARRLFGINQRPQMLLSGLFIGGYFALLAALFSGEFDVAEGLKDTLLLLLGVITREVPTIMQFWFGSSIGSKSKDAPPLA